MRKRERIDLFLMEIGTLWEENFTDWRFGQLMFNFISAYGDPFYLEENEFLIAFKAYCKGEDPRKAIVKTIKNT